MSVQQQHNLAWSGPERAFRTPDILYCCCAVLLVGAVSFVHLFAPANIVSYERDVWHHIAVLNELMRAPFHPSNPHIVSDAPSRSFMPWYVMLALFGRWLGLGAQQLLGISAAASMAVLVVGIRLFARAYFGSKWAPLLLLGVMFGAWAGPINHTGFYSGATMLFSASYPFAIVLGLGFVAWWVVLQMLRAPRAPIGLDIAVALLTAFMFATHQLQAAFAIGGMLIFALFHGEAPFLRRCRIPAAVIAGFALCHFWPYYDPIAFSLGSENYAADYKSAIDWMSVPGLIGILWVPLFGVAGLYDFKYRVWRLDLAIGAAAIFAGILVARVMGLWIGLRFVPFFILFLQLALTAWLLDFLQMKTGAQNIRNLVGTALAIAILSNAGLSVKSLVMAELYLAGRSELRGAEWSRDILASMVEVKALIGAGKVVLAEGHTAYPVQASDMKVVSIPRPFPEVADSVERQAASIAFFASETGMAARCAILARYGVTALLYRTDRVPSDVQHAIAGLGSPVPIHDLTLVRLPVSASAACPSLETKRP
jgi:hypothetical protein